MTATQEFRITGFVWADGYWYGYRRNQAGNDVDEVTYMTRSGLRVVHDSRAFDAVREQAFLTDPVLRRALTARG